MSYAHEDRLLVRRVAQGLTSYGLKVWIDEGELLVGDSIIERISSAIESVNFVVAIVSKYSVESSWCKKELALAMTGDLKRRGIKVLPLRVGETTIPPALLDLMYLQLDEDNVDDVVSQLVLAAMRHNTEHRVAEALTPPSVSKGSSELLPPRLETASKSSSKLAGGTVKWFNAEKGFGFISQDGGGPDVFAHFSRIEGTGYRTLEENQRVEFEIIQGLKGPEADHIRPLAKMRDALTDYARSGADSRSARGTVKWFNAEKGFGFISQDGGGPDVFAHFSEIEGTGYRTLEENQRVEFEITLGPNGPMATQIRTPI